MYCGLTSPDGSVRRRAWSIAPWPPCATGQPLVGPGQAGQDRKPGRVGRRIAERAEVVGVHVPDGFLGRVPQAVGVREFDTVGIREQVRVAGPRHAVQLVGGVAVLVPDDQVRVAALAVL